MDESRKLGVIADMQCGGWSTTLLTAKGTLHSVGILDGGRVFAAVGRLQPLGFPPGYPTSSAEAQFEEPTIAIRQFSAGRDHILALSDSGRIWSWYHIKDAALQVKFATVDMKELSLASHTNQSSTYGKVKQVVAGWSHSSAYIHGTGIVIWDPVERDHDDKDSDTMLVLEAAEVPGTGYQRGQANQAKYKDEQDLGDEIGVVLNHIILEHFVVLVTDIGKVFCGRIGEKNRVDHLLELRPLRTEPGTPLDVQGSFRRFAVFRDKEVITSDQSFLEACWNDQRNNPEQTDIAGLNRIQALQNKDVISVAFGDYHYLALHSNGQITSYGKELQACGALGLGEDDEALARGVVYERFSHDGSLLPHAYTNGRQVWFDHNKKEWIRQIMWGGKDPEEASERIQLCRDSHNVQGEVSEWIEQESRAWDKSNGGEDGLGAYFALSISAAGWHSGALMLVNEELNDSGTTMPIGEQSFPRLKLADGTEMPGTKAFDEWKEGRPEWNISPET